MPSPLDQATGIRTGEALPLDRLGPYLLNNVPGANEPITVEQFPHGHSNLTYLIKAGDLEMVLRRPPFGNVVKSAHDMGREYRVLSHLSPVYPPAPKPYLHCDDDSVIGAAFYVMERRHGMVLRQKTSTSDIDPATARNLCHALIDNLVALHALDYRAGGLGDLGKPEGYVERQVSGWIKRYEQAKTDNVPALDRVMAWLGANRPAESGAALIHNDYKYDNLLLDPTDPTKIVAVLDWEMATVGDPLMDLGTTLGYWVHANDPPALRAVATGPTFIPGSLTRQELVDRYAEKSGCPVPNPLFYYSFGLFKIAVIVQQIYARYVRGHTKDERFGRMNGFVAALAEQADHSLGAGHV